MPLDSESQSYFKAVTLVPQVVAAEAFNPQVSSACFDQQNFNQSPLI